MRVGDEKWAWRQMLDGHDVASCRTGLAYCLGRKSDCLVVMRQRADGSKFVSSGWLPADQYRLLTDQSADGTVVPLKEAMELCDGWTTLHEASLKHHDKVLEAVNLIRAALGQIHRALSDSNPGTKKRHLLDRKQGGSG